MKTSIAEDGNPLIEYEPSDIPLLKSGELPWVFGLVQTKPKSEGGESTWFRFNPEALEIWNKEEKAYWMDIEKRLKAQQTAFLSAHRKSPDPTRTLQNEIEKVTWQLYPKDHPETPAKLDLNPNSHVGPSAIRLNRGERNFESLNLHYHQKQADTLFKYLDWLRGLQASGGEAMGQSDAEPTHKNEGGTGAENGPKLTQRQAAYLLAYRNAGIRDPRADPERLTDKLAKQLCKKFSATTGEQLYRKYDKLRSKIKRQQAFNSELDKYKNGNPDKRAIEAILEDVKTIIPLLEGEQKAQAEDDLNRWKTAYSNEVE